MIIDFHMHAFKDSLAEKAIGHLVDICGVTPVTDGTLAEALDRMDSCGIDKGVFLSIATKPAQQTNINNWCVSVASERVVPFGSVHPLAEDAVAELERIRSMGILGVKLHPDYQGFMVDDERVFPVYEALSRMGLPVIFHAGYDPVSPDTVHASPRQLARIIKLFPRLVVVAAHMGGMMMAEEVERWLVGQPIYMDTAIVTQDPGEAHLERLIKAHGTDKIVFGSDCPWGSPAKALENVRRMGLSLEDSDRIFSGNARRILAQSEAFR